MGISQRKAGEIGVALILIVLAFAHFRANIAMQKDIEDAVRAFVELIPTFGSLP